MADEPKVASEDDIHDYVDGRMDADREAAFELALSQDPDLAAQVFAYKSQNERIKALYDPILGEDLPERIRELVEARPAPTWRPMALRAASYVVAVIAGLGAGWWGHDRLTSPDYLLRPVVRQALLTYDLAKARTDIDATLAGVEGEDIPAGFLPASSAFPVRLPTLKGRFFRPVALSSSTSNTGSTINVTYRDKEEELVTLHVQQLDTRREIPLEFAEGEEHPVLYWIDGSLVYVLVSDKSRDELIAIAREIYSARAMSRSLLKDPVGPRN